ncbi:hypothetical protein QQ020_29955 [Fulvivirgaceae bacterium BMA12]|uniref:Golvesin/Xly CBD-like domain-containing protein n=1 Tax=Agaribacillus aureus TaxID=3051825 RepID=A0ABT8LEX5_9BACT|nr:hypothetical protein [Fulvivirgaceae bacterium BMA12]
MTSLRNIAIIARYEAKILWRNWFFRIFALAIIIILIFFNIGVFSSISNNRWFQRAISSGIPYANMIFLNVVQVAVLIFLATGIIKNNKKLDTNEVFYVKPISNADLVLGKALALFKLFFWLNAIILTIALIVNATSIDADINFKAYVYYPLLISFPNVVFTTALAFLMVTIVRNQAVSIILLLGLIAVILIYFRDKYYFLTDYIAFKLPLRSSDITGFSNLYNLILHRVIFLCLAVSFLFVSIFFLNRLPQKKVHKLATATIASIFLIAGASLITHYYDRHNTNELLRQEMITLNGEMADVPNIEIRSCYLDIKHAGHSLEGKAKLEIQNNQIQPLQDLFLVLNPGLKVSKLTLDGQEVSFTRKSHFILFRSQKEMPTSAIKRVEVHYEGVPSEAACYLGISPERYKKSWELFLYNIEKRYAFLQKDYVLLTSESLWYPTATAGYNRLTSGASQHNFTNFKLKVTTREDLLPISQGQVTEAGPGIYEFTPAFPLPQISLVIGNYDKKGIAVDSIDFNLFVHKGNDYFSEYFDQVQDTLALLISDLKNAYEQDQNIKYPFPRLQLVEAPVQFYAFNKTYENHQAYIQPEMVFLPEKGGNIGELDFRRQFKQMNRQAKRNNQLMDDKDKQANVFNNFVKTILTQQKNTSTYYWRSDGNVEVPNYGISPNLYWYQTGVSSKKWPLLNKNLANYLHQDNRYDRDMSRNWRGISLTEDCNNLMQEKDLEEILTSEKNFDKIAKVIELKGEYLFTYFEHLMGKEDFRSFLYDLVHQHSNEIIPYDSLRATIKNHFHLDIEPIVERVYSQGNLPAFIVSGLREYRVLDGDRNRYQVKLMVENVGVADGMIKVDFKYNKGNQANPPTTFDNHFGSSLISKGQKKEISFLLDEKPRRIFINTMISKNIPSVINLSLGQFEMNTRAKPSQGELIVQDEDDAGLKEIIVDNEDQGFSTFSPIQEPYFRKLILENRKERNQKYYGVWRRSATQWRPTTGSSYFGKYIRSAHFTRPGKGEKLAIWQATITEEGYYDVYVYLSGEDGNNAFSQNQSQRKNINYRYHVSHDDGEDEITVDISRAERGWNFIGSFYFSNGTAKVTLSDESENRSVFADAVKWVKQ